MTGAFLAALAAYGAVVLGIGIAVSRRAASSDEEWIVGGRRFGLLLTWAALSSTTIGGSTTLVLASLVAAKGLPGLWLDLAGALGLLALGLFLASRVRETGAATISEVVGRFYGPEVRRVAAVLVVLAEIVWFALLTQATETVVTAITPWDPDVVLAATAALFVAYTAFGGQRAVVGTDLFQFGLMVLAIVLVGFPAALAALSARPAEPALLSFPVSAAFRWTDVAALLVLVGLPHAVGGDVWAKVLSATDAATARRAALLAAVSKVVFGLAVGAIALAGAARGIALGPALFPKAILALAPPVLGPLVLVALLATMQSSSDSVLLTAAASTAHDLLPGRFGPRGRRALVVTFGALGLLVALRLRDLVETFRLGYALFASGLILPTLAAFSRRWRVVPGAAAAAMLLGGASMLAERAWHPVGADPVLVGTGVNALALAFGARRR